MDESLGTKYENLELHEIENKDTLRISLAEVEGRGPNVFDRVKDMSTTLRLFSHSPVFWPRKFATSTPKEVTSGFDEINWKYFSGVNFATQDYMSMCGNPSSIKAATDALKDFGTHSGNTPTQFGNNKYTMLAQQALEDYFHCLFGRAYGKVFSAGWLAGYGAIRGLVQPHDIIIMDALGHNCLKEGAKASMAKTFFHRHLDTDHLEEILVRERAAHPDKSILVVTESLFSMDSDCPDLGKVQQLAKKNDAFVLVDAAHDMFCTGKNGRGYVSDYVTDFSNVVIIGSGSKSLSSNFGFLVTGNKDIHEMLSASCPAHLSSDCLPPATAATVAHNIGVMASEEGYRKRKQVNDNSKYIIKRLEAAGFEIIGFASPIVIVYIGSELLSRAIANLIYYKGIVVNSVEFPAVGLGESRLRLQVQANHTREHCDKFVDALEEVIPEVEDFLSNDEKTAYLTKMLMKVIMEKAKGSEKL